MILNTKRIHNSFWRNFPARAKQMPSKVLLVGKKKRRPRPFDRSLRARIVIVGNSIWVKNHHFSAQLSHSVLVYAKTIIHLSVDG